MKQTTETKEAKEVKEEPKKVPPSPVSEIKSNVALIERAVATLEPRFTHRVLRSLTTLRKKLDNKVLRDAIEDIFPSGSHLVVLHYCMLIIGSRIRLLGKGGIARMAACFVC